MSPKEKEVTAPADICFHKLLHREDKEDMSFKLVNELPSPAEILEQFPLPEKATNSLLSSDLVPQIMKMLSATMQTVLQRFRKRQKTDFSLYQEFIPISQEPQAKAIWVCSISRTRKKSLICFREF